MASLQFTMGRVGFRARDGHGVFAFSQDPSGYRVEMREKGGREELGVPLREVLEPVQPPKHHGILN